MKYYMISEQDLYEILVDLENSLFTNLERLEMRNDEEYEDEKECDITTNGDSVAKSVELANDF